MLRVQLTQCEYSWCHVVPKTKNKMVDKTIHTHVFPPSLRQGKKTTSDKLFAPTLLPQARDNRKQWQKKPTTPLTTHSP